MAILSTIVSIFYVILLVVVLLLVIADNSPTPNKLAWILILAAFPVLGLVLYFLVGFSIREKWKYEKRHESSLKVFMEQRTPELSDLIYGDGGDLVDERWRPLVKLLSGPMSRAHCGNSYEIITKGERKLELLLQDLAAARHSIHVEYFHFGNDEAARKIKELLMQKAREGVQVRFIYERLANFPIPSRYYYEMKKAGVQIVRYKGPHGGLLSHVTTLNYRDHRKIMLIDGKIGYTGGMNIAKRYAVGIRNGIWRDTHIRVAGPVVAQMQTAFLVDWKFSTKQLLDQPVYYPQVPAAGGLLMQVATSGPMGEFRVIMQAILRIFSESRRYVYVQTPYFIPNEPLGAALRNAALAGVDVRLIIPRWDDVNFIVTLASRSYISDLLAAGVKVYFYEKGFMHAKTVVADDEVCSIGSTNLDIRSFEQDFEINAFIYDRDMAVRIRDCFLDDLSGCSQVFPDEWAKRPATVRFAESFARLFSPLL